MNKNGLTDNDFINIKDTKWDKIRRAACSACFNTNETSMVVLSTSLTNENSQNTPPIKAAIYVGDYPTRYDDYVNKLVAFMKSNYIYSQDYLVHISHHGADRDLTDYALITFYYAFSNQHVVFFVCYGSSHPYGHGKSGSRVHLRFNTYDVRHVTNTSVCLII
jgi:hypothetical protein